MASPRFSDSLASRSASCQLAVALTMAAARLAGLPQIRQNSGAHEHAFGTEFHHQGGVGRGGHTTGGEVHDGQTAVVVHVLGQIVGHGQLLGGLVDLCRRAGRQVRRITACSWCACGARPRITSPVPGSPLVRITAAPSAMRRSASPRLFAPHTNGTSNWFLSMVVHVVGRGKHLGFVDVMGCMQISAWAR